MRGELPTGEPQAARKGLAGTAEEEYARRMAAEEPAAAGQGRLGGMLDEARERGFVGRAAQLDAFSASLGGASDVRLHHIHGPGGIGKTTLLDAMARLAGCEGRSVAYLDAREVACSAEAVTAALGGADPDVLLVDGYELLEPLDGWFRERFLPARPATAVTVFAGRAAPQQGWLLDPGWRRLVQIHELTGLDPEQSAELLAGLGVAESDRESLARLGRGHPLVLAMLAEAAAGGAVPAQLSDAPDVAARLCRVIIDDVPDAAHRSGLATCAHASRMTHDLLVHAVGNRADEVWAWLESRPYVRRGTVGLFLHEVVREAFEAEFAQRAPEAYASLHRRIKDYFLRRLVDPQEVHPDRAAAEILMLHRRGPLSAYTTGLREGGLLPVSRAGLEDHEEILRLVEEAEGPAAAAVARRWVAEQPRCLYRVRSDGGVIAFAMQVYVPVGGRPGEDDPVALAALRAVEEDGPLRPGERININRFAGASGPYLRDPMVLLVNGVSCILEWGLEPAAWTFIATLDADLYGPYFTYLGMRRMFTLDHFGRELAGYGWDRRRLPPPDLFELMSRRELTGETGPPPASMLRPAPISRDAFAAAVREALVALARPDRLADSPAAGDRTGRTGGPGLDLATPDGAARGDRLARGRAARGGSPRRPRADLPQGRALSGGRRAAARAAVQHLPPPPRPRAGAPRRAAVGGGDRRTTAAERRPRRAGTGQELSRL